MYHYLDDQKLWISVKRVYIIPEEKISGSTITIVENTKMVNVMGIKEDLDKLYGVTEEEIDKIIFDQYIEDEEEKLKILKEIRKYKSFEDYVRNHEKDFDMVDITDDFKMIIISSAVYPNIKLDVIKKMGIIADHYGIFIYTEPLIDKKIAHKE